MIQISSDVGFLIDSINFYLIPTPFLRGTTNFIVVIRDLTVRYLREHILYFYYPLEYK